MGTKIIADLETAAKALKTVATRSHSGVEVLKKLTKLGPTALAASAPNILGELKQLETEAQRLLKVFRELLNKSTASKEN